MTCMLNDPLFITNEDEMNWHQSIHAKKKKNPILVNFCPSQLSDYCSFNIEYYAVTLMVSINMNYDCLHIKEK